MYYSYRLRTNGLCKIILFDCLEGIFYSIMVVEFITKSIGYPTVESGHY